MFAANLANTGSTGQRYRPAFEHWGKGPNLPYCLKTMVMLQIHLSLTLNNFFIKVLLGNFNIQGYVDRTTTPILAVILHIHSKNDLCERCTHTLSQFLSKPKGLIERFKVYIRGTYQPDGGTEHEPSFLLVASSRINSQNRRVLYGHDGHFVDPINIRAFPPWFVQVALPDPPRPQSLLVRLVTRIPTGAATRGLGSHRGGRDGPSSSGGRGEGSSSGGRGTIAMAVSGDVISHPDPSGSGDSGRGKEGEEADIEGDPAGKGSSGIAVDEAAGSGVDHKVIRARSKGKRAADTLLTTEEGGLGDVRDGDAPPHSRRRVTTTAAAITTPPPEGSSAVSGPPHISTRNRQSICFPGTVMAKSKPVT